MIKKTLAFFVTVLMASACQAHNVQDINIAQLKTFDSNIDNTKHTYTNPVINTDFPDPEVFKASNGWFYAYATQTPGKNIQAAKSQDMVHWQMIDDILPVKPKWAADTQNFWAPHVMEDKGIYYLYYSAEIKGKGLALAVATSRSAEGPFVDSGEPMLTGEGFVNIDPMPFDDPKTKKKYLYWGSGFQPIKVQELSDDRIHFAKGSKAVNIISPSKAPHENLVEGAWVIYRNGYYYMFYSGDNCCDMSNGKKPDYVVMVARARKPTGPFQKLNDSTYKGNSVILDENSKWTGVGHNSVLTDKKGQDWIVYHGIDKNDMFIPGTHDVKRPMLIDKINYRDGWPYIENNSASTEEKEAPVL